MADEAQFTIIIDAEGNAKRVSVETGDALEQLRVKATAAQESLKTAAGSLRLLRGNSDEVKTAQGELRAQQDKARASLSAANLEILKQGTSLGSLNRVAKEKLDADAKAKRANDEAKEGAEGLNNGLLRLLGVSREQRTALSELQNGLKLTEVVQAGLVAGTIALAVAFVAATVAIVGGTYALAKWILTAGDANRSLALSRQWIAGSAADSQKMGDQIDRLRQKIPLTTAELSKLYATTRSALDGSRVSGQSILDVVTAVGTASGAGADKAAAKIQELAERNKAFGRFQLNVGGIGLGANHFGELGGTGLDANDVAKHLAENTRVSLATARAELRRGSVSYVEGIKALRQTAEAAFGEINAKKMLSLSVLTNKFHDDLSALTKGINFEPFLTALARVEHLFSTTSTSGYALKQIVTSIGTIMGVTATGGAPLLETAIRLIILQATKLTITIVRFATVAKTMFSGVEVGASRLIGILYAMRDALLAMTGPLGVAVTLGHQISRLEGGESKFGYETGGHGINTATSTLNGTGSGARGIAGGNASTLVAPAHAAGGLVAKPAPGEYFASVAPGERIVPAGGGGGGRARGAMPPVVVNFSYTGGAKNGPEVVATLKGSSFVADLTKALSDAMRGAGVPTS